MSEREWSTIWRERYGVSEGAPVAVTLTAVLEQQYRHKSVRAFIDLPVGDDEVRAIIGAAQSASVSSNLQVWSVVAVRDAERRRRISAAIGGRDFIEQAAVLLVFLADFARATDIVRSEGEEIGTIDYLENTLVGFVDAGIAGQNAILAAESLGLGGVFVGSLRNAPLAVRDELGLPRYTFPAFGIAIGRPDVREGTGIKPRLPLEAILHWDQYDPHAGVSAARAYEDRINAYFRTQNRPEYSWKRLLINRLKSVAGLHGREKIRGQLTEQGLASR